MCVCVCVCVCVTSAADTLHLCSANTKQLRDLWQTAATGVATSCCHECFHQLLSQVCHLLLPRVFPPAAFTGGATSCCHGCCHQLLSRVLPPTAVTSVSTSCCHGCFHQLLPRVFHKLLSRMLPLASVIAPLNIAVDPPGMLAGVVNCT